MTQLEQQMIDELAVAQGFTNDLAANLTTKGVPSSISEGLDTLVPKVLEIESGEVKSPYDEWQEGFGYNWDSVVANAPMTNVYRILHIYTKVEFLKMISNFPTSAEIYTYNGSVYRQITMDVNKRLSFIEADYMTNSFDNLQYVCVVYGYERWGDNYYFNTYLPVVYSNSKNSLDDNYVNLINIGGGQTYTLYPFLRGVDCYLIGNILIGNSLEHLTTQNYAPTLQITRIAGSDQQARILKDIIDNAPIGTTITLNEVYLIRYALLYISDEKLADWFYNDLCYNLFTGVSYIYGFPVSNVVRTFKIRPDINFYNRYLLTLPNMVYIDGVITEDQTKIADINAGWHEFRNSGWRMLQNFPMWKVLEGATTGCLLPMTNQTNVNNYLSGSFRFYSTNLEPNKFCEFDENGIIEDPTKYFICNLPIETETHVNIQVKFDDLTFKNYFTAAQQSAISTYLTNKKWNLIWS